MEQENVSPLQHFVVAKRTICAVFHQLLEFVRDCSDFVEGKDNIFWRIFINKYNGNPLSQIKSPLLYSAFNNTNCVKATAQY